MADRSSNHPDDPTSEVGFSRANESATSESNSDTQWRLLFELQNQQMQALIHALKSPSVNVVLPEFNPEKQESDAASWCSTADLCFGECAMEGGQLIMTISKALKGSASTWLSQVSYPGITWAQFKELFKARFVCVETSAATLIKIYNEKPKEDETYAAYSSRLITSLLNQWKDLSVEQIAVSTVIAYLAQIDTRLQRLAFTTDIKTRHQLQQELQAFSYLKRKNPSDGRTTADTGNEKRPRFSSPLPIKCHACGKLGHKQAECRTEKINAKKPSPAPVATTSFGQRQQTGSLTCYKCGAPGHIANRCTAPASGAAAPAEKRVDLCVVEPPSGTL